jgi:hypothetical protein
VLVAVRLEDGGHVRVQMGVPSVIVVSAHEGERGSDRLPVAIRRRCVAPGVNLRPQQVRLDLR